MKKIIKMYLHSDKDNNYGKANDLGLSEDAAKEFSYALYEVECSVEVDLETGETKLLNAKEI